MEFVVVATVCRKDKWLLVGIDPWMVKQAVFPVMEETVDFEAGRGV
jgi:hypothetical protein